MLIQCQKCKNMIPDKYSFCPNCGTQLNINAKQQVSNKNICLVNGEYVDFTPLLDVSFSDGKKAINTIMEISGLDKYQATDLFLIIKHANRIPDEYNRGNTIKSYKKMQRQKDDIIRCPKCYSTAITTGARGFSFWTGFLGSGQTVNRCAKCGHVWKPKG